MECIGGNKKIKKEKIESYTIQKELVDIWQWANLHE